MEEQATNTKSVIIVVSVISILALTAGGFFVYQKFKSTQISQSPTPVSQVSASPTLKPLRLSPTPDPTADWKTYINSKYEYQLKYPLDWEVAVDSKSENKELTIESPKGELVHTTIFNTGNNGAEGAYRKLFPLKNNQVLLITYVECDGPGCGFGKLDIPTFNQIVSTFKLLTSDEEKQKIDAWIQANNLNIYGDSKDMMYAGGTPLFNESSGEKIDRYDYIISRHPDRPWNNN